jgi:hypothetical protein
MAPLITAVLLACLLSPSIAIAQVQEAWANRYGGPGNWTDYPSDIAVDTAGNVYVTGSVGVSNGPWDYATVKYDADGHQLWAASFNGTGNSYDAARAIAIDGTGNVYVTGESVAPGFNFDYVTIKYDAQGNQLWIARFNGPLNGHDYPQDIAVDDFGRIYVTGKTAAASLYDYATVAYDADGNELWLALYDGPGSSDDGARAMAIDGVGHIHVTGESRGVGTGLYDYATAKYDSNGNELWVARYSDPGDSSDSAVAIGVDASGGVYVTGAVGMEGARAYGTIKYDAEGQELWVARFAPPGASGVSVSSLAVGADGHAYVTGSFFETGGASDSATIKYDTDGNERWVARGDGGADIALGAEGDLYVTGSRLGANDRPDFTTTKYDPDGHAQWSVQYNGPANSGDNATEIAVDASGNVYVSGSSFDPATERDWVTVKYAQFDPVEPQYTLTVAKAGLGNGTVRSSPEGIQCGADCQQLFPGDTSVTLTATPRLGSIFTGWEGCDVAAGRTCTVIVNAERSVTAHFLGVPLRILR